MTGQALPYTKVATLNINDSIEAEFKTIDYNVKFQCSPILKNTQTVINSYLQYGLLTDISNEFGFNTSSWIKNSYSATIDSGAATVDIKVGYSSGANASGYFDYIISNDQNYIENFENWKIDGEFKCFGPLDYKLNQIALFKENNTDGTWRNYLTGLIMNSSIYGSNHDTSKLFSPNMKIDMDENPKTATLKLSLLMEAGYESSGLADMKYSISASPSRWIYELLPSATIEGAYVIQNLQTKTQPRQTFSMSCKTYNKPLALSLLSGYLDNLANTYVISGTVDNVTAFLVEEKYSTGTYDVSYSKTWLGQDSDVSTGLLSLQAVGTSSAAVPLRLPSYNFGY